MRRSAYSKTMRHWSLYTLLVLAATNTVVVAQDETGCECLWQGPFSQVQANTDLVISGTVVASKGNSVDIRVDRKMRGAEFSPQVRVWLQTENYCRPAVEQFPIGGQWVFALERIEEDVPGGFNPSTPNYSYGRIGDYSLSSCGGYWLKQEGQQVTGNLAPPAPRWNHEPKMSPVLVDLVAAFVAGDTDEDALVEAARDDPELRRLRLNTREFLRGLVESTDPETADDENNPH